jgi:molybdopterin converting factor small subunit
VTLVRLRGPLKTLAGDCAEHDLDGASVADLPLRGWIVDERGHIRRHINVFINGERGREATAVAAEDRIDVIPAISGGGWA